MVRLPVMGIDLNEIDLARILRNFIIIFSIIPLVSSIFFILTTDAPLVWNTQLYVIPLIRFAFRINLITLLLIAPLVLAQELYLHSLQFTNLSMFFFRKKAPKLVRAMINNDTVENNLALQNKLVLIYVALIFLNFLLAIVIMKKNYYLQASFLYTIGYLSWIFTKTFSGLGSKKWLQKITGHNIYNLFLTLINFLNLFLVLGTLVAYEFWALRITGEETKTASYLNDKPIHAVFFFVLIMFCNIPGITLLKKKGALTMRIAYASLSIFFILGTLKAYPYLIDRELYRSGLSSLPGVTAMYKQGHLSEK